MFTYNHDIKQELPIEPYKYLSAFISTTTVFMGFVIKSSLSPLNGNQRCLLNMDSHTNFFQLPHDYSEVCSFLHQHDIVKNISEYFVTGK